MGLMDDEGVGARIRTARNLHQLTQQHTANAAGISVSYLEKLERGARLPTHDVLVRLAGALRTDVTRLNGQPDFTDRDVSGVIPELRRVLLCYRNPARLTVAPRSLAKLRVEVEKISRHRRAAQYAQVAPSLPGVLTELGHVALGAEGSERREAFGLLATGYRAANSLAHKLGYYDLSTSALERTEWAAEQSEDPLAVATARYLLGGAMLREGAIESGVHLLEGVERDLVALSAQRPRTIQDTGVHGAILLKLAILTARGVGNRNPGAYFEEADRLAATMGGDKVVYETTFGPVNVAIHKVAAEIEIGEMDNAVRMADGMVLPDDLAPERSSHHHIDVAHAKLATGDREGTLKSLQEARKLAPQHTRHHPRVRDTAAALLRQDRGNRESIAGFARWSGIDL
ncbi:helix-turn-helix domain-containing protein [Embleya sp. NPDC001921]